MTTAYPLHWPENWPRCKSPENSQFKTSLEGALNNVEKSLRMFTADSGKKMDNIVTSSNFALMERKPTDAGVAVYFTWDGLSTCIAVDRYATIKENLQAIHHCIEAERTKLRHGGLNLVRAAFRGYAALPPPRAARTPYDILGVKPGASAVEIDAAYKKKVAECHPDAPNGSVNLMTELNLARDKLKAAR